LEQIGVFFLYNIIGRLVLPLKDWQAYYLEQLIALLAPGTPRFQPFGGPWYLNLPMDQQINDNFMPIQFTEIFVDLEDVGEAMQIVRAYANSDHNYNKVGTFSWEFYCASKNKHWLHPSFGRDSYRIDILWYDINKVSWPDDHESPYNFYNQFWTYLIKNMTRRNIRFHFGKWQPNGNSRYPIPEEYLTWKDYYAKQYPKFQDFLNLRKSIDPKGLFVSKYWSQQFGIPYAIQEDVKK